MVALGKYGLLIKIAAAALALYFLYVLLWKPTRRGDKAPTPAWERYDEDEEDYDDGDEEDYDEEDYEEDDEDDEDGEDDEDDEDDEDGDDGDEDHAEDDDVETFALQDSTPDDAMDGGVFTPSY